MDRRYRRLQLMISAAIVPPLLMTGGATAESSAGHPNAAAQVHPEPAKHGHSNAAEHRAGWSKPAARGPAWTSVTPTVTRLSLGGFESPAVGVTVQNGATTPGVPLAQGEPPPGPRARSLSVVRASTARFSSVGVTWRETEPIGTVRVAIRGHRPGGDWAAWQAVGPAESDRDAAATPAPASPAPAIQRAPAGAQHRSAAPERMRGGTDLVWLGTSDGIQLTVTAVGGRTPHDVTADLIDPGDQPSDANPTTTPNITEATPGAARVAMPPIVRRADWGANERQMDWRPEYATAVKAVAWHHTATSNDYAAADVPKILRSIYQYQTVSRGWGDIGYNVLVDRFGRLWEGRSGGLSRPVVGAQAGGFNTGTAGIAVIGTHSTVAVPPAAVESAARYIAWKFSLGPAVDPRGTVTLTGGGSTSRYPVGTSITVPRVFPHRQTSATECPGARGMDALPVLRERAAQLLGDLVRPETIRTRLAVWRPSDASFRVPDAAAPIFTGTPGDLPVPADYDGDGATDVGTWTPSTGTWKILMSADGSIHSMQWGAAGDRPVPADYDGDGRAELAVWRPSTTDWIIQGIGQFPYGQAGDIPLPADYTGDGRADAGIWRPSTGIWYMRGLGEFHLGETWHIPVPADYNGDGTADPASWSPVSQRFFIRGQAPVSLGAAADIPVPAQYDGDGKADFAVYHATGDGHAEFQIRGLGDYVSGAPGDVPVPLR
jgi:hypothetical protein